MHRLHVLLVVTALTLVGGAIPDSPPAPVTLTAKEQGQIDKRKVAVRLESSDQGGFATGIIDIQAPPDAVWNALMDLEARVPEIGGLKEVEIYEKTDSRVGARWRLGMFGITVRFSILYDLDPSRRWCRYALDTSHENDLADVQGAYQLYEHNGGTRLVYRSISDSGRRVPQWIKNWLATGSLSEQMTGIRGRAEAAR